MAQQSVGTVDGLAQLAFLVHGLLENRADECELSMIQMRLLGVLRDRTPTMNELASLLGLDKSSVSGLIDRAERRGLVERAQAGPDRRVVRVTLTRRGRTLAADAAVRFAADVDELVGRLPVRERTALTTSISRLLVAHAEANGVDLFATGAGPMTATS